MVNAWKFPSKFKFSLKSVRHFVDIEDLKDTQADDSSTSDAQKIEYLEQQLKEKDALIEQLVDQISKMKVNFHEWVERMENVPAPDASSSENAISENAENVERTVAKIPIEDDESYFVTYAHFDIHYEMLSVS